MNTRSRIAGLALVAALALGACGSSGKSSSATTTTKPNTSSTTTTNAKAGATTTTTAKAGATTTSAKAGATTTTTTSKPTTAAAAAKVDLGTTSLGKVLVDAQGLTLYLYKDDVQGKTSNCTSSCATAWPPLTTTGTPTAGTGVTASLLGTITRSDGTKQVTYNGWPLYRHAADTKPGDVTGQGVESKWYVVNAAGNAVTS